MIMVVEYMWDNCNGVKNWDNEESSGRDVVWWIQQHQINVTKNTAEVYTLYYRYYRGGSML